MKFSFDDGSQPEVIDLTGVEKQRTIKYDTNVVNFGRVKVGDERVQSDGATNQSSRTAYFNYTFDPASPVFQLI